MNDSINIHARDLLALSADCSEIQMQDMVRGIVPPTEILFNGGTLGLSEAGMKHLCIAIQNGTIRGDTVKATKFLRELQKPQPEADVLLSLDAARRICVDVIEGRSDGNPEKAREILEYLNRQNPSC